MTLKLIFSSNREVFTITIKNRIIHYWDRKQKDPIQFLPKDPEIERKIIMSRNRIPKYIIVLINEANTGRSFEEYQSCETDMEMVPIIKRDAGIKGCIFHKMEVIED